MTAYRNRFNAATQTNGTNVTATNSADSGDALASITNTGTSTDKYDTSSPPSAGCAWVSFVPQNGFVSTADFLIPTPSNDVTVEHVFNYPGAPSVANTGIYGFRSAANVRIGEFVVSTAGKPNFQPSGGTTMAAWTGTALTVGQKRIRVKLHTDSTTPANGTVAWYVYNDADVLEASGSGTGTINGGTIGIVRHGCTSSTWAVAGNWTAWKYGMMQWADQSVDLGPFPTATANANAGPDWLIEAFQSNLSGDGAKARANLDGTQSTTTGTGTISYLWAPHAGGSGITFSNATTATTQAIIPVLLTDRSDVIDLTVSIATADGTISSTDSTTVTTKAAEHAVAVGGAWVPAGQMFA
jgi:hypothetical protein